MRWLQYTVRHIMWSEYEMPLFWFTLAKRHAYRPWHPDFCQRRPKNTQNWFLKISRPGGSVWKSNNFTQLFNLSKTPLTSTHDQGQYKLNFFIKYDLKKLQLHPWTAQKTEATYTFHRLAVPIGRFTIIMTKVTVTISVASNVVTSLATPLYTYIFKIIYVGPLGFCP